MAYCLMTPSHYYLNQFWLIISEVCGFYLGQIHKKILKTYMLKMSLKITNWELQRHVPGAIVLTHWGWVTHICVSKLTIIVSDNGLLPGWHQAIIWTNSGILLSGTSGPNISELSIKIPTFLLKKIHLKMSSRKWQPFCFSLNVLTGQSPLFAVNVSPGLMHCFSRRWFL